jgi:hypothetical protein
LMNKMLLTLIAKRTLFGTIIWKIVIYLLGVKRNYFRLRI